MLGATSVVCDGVFTKVSGIDCRSPALSDIATFGHVWCGFSQTSVCLFHMQVHWRRLGPHDQAAYRVIVVVAAMSAVAVIVLVVVVVVVSFVVVEK